MASSDLLRSSLRSNSSYGIGANNENGSVVFEGWLTKSPPEKRIWKSKWRQRYFVLKQGQFPGQYLLEYFEDMKCKKPRGVINLDELEQVDAGLQLQTEYDSKSAKYVFDIKTSQRLYYLATKTEENMKQWVAAICQVCGLQVRDESAVDSAQVTSPPVDDYRYSPNPSSDQSGSNTSVGTVATACYMVPTNNRKAAVVQSNSRKDLLLSNSGDGVLDEADNPYIPISECRSGCPVIQEPAAVSTTAVGATTAVSNNATGGDAVAGGNLIPPPRPPKPATLRRNKDGRVTSNGSFDYDGDCNGHHTNNYKLASKNEPSPTRKATTRTTEPVLTTKVPFPKLHLESSVTSTNNNEDKSLDQMYSFPKPIDHSQVVPPPHSASKTHQYFNAAPGRLITKENIFNYDFSRPSLPTSSSILSCPPEIRKDPSSSSLDRSPRTPNGASVLIPGVPPPIVDRNLKPRRRSTASSTSISPRNDRRSTTAAAEKQKRKDEGLDIQYLDLDLDSSDGSSPRTPNVDKEGNSIKGSPARDVMSESAKSAAAGFVYKEIDFIRTDALTKMRQAGGGGGGGGGTLRSVSNFNQAITQ